MDSSVIRLMCVEVCPLESNGREDGVAPHFSAPFVKLELLQSALAAQLSVGECTSSLFIHWDDNEGESKDGLSLFSAGLLSSNKPSTGDAEKPVVYYLKQENPLIHDRWPCYVRAYAMRGAGPDKARRQVEQAVVVKSTLVRILPSSGSMHHSIWKSQLTGEVQEQSLSDSMMDEILHNHNPDTISELSLRMKVLLDQPTKVGTTRGALERHRADEMRHKRIRQTLRIYQTSGKDYEPSLVEERKAVRKPEAVPKLVRHGALLVHSPDHGAGKTVLVETIARRHVNCHRVHIIRPGPLLAKYGIYADAALETIVHETALEAAFRNERVCVVFDHFDAMNPPGLSRSSGYGDAADPALNGIASYLGSLSQSVQRRLEIPFPARNTLYSLDAQQGWVNEVNICFVAVVTCPDNGWERSRSLEGRTTILDWNSAGRYRLPELAAKTRISAFRFALETQSVQVTVDLNDRLPSIAASAAWARGEAFHCVARKLRGSGPVDVEPFVAALAFASKTHANSGTVVEFLGEVGDGGTFSSVGGNVEAKEALEDALAFDAARRRLLRSLGLSPPTGILLFGPPGNGKSMLAKAVASILKSRGGQSSSIGGAFISLNSSDVVQAEVGSGEKIVVSSFETARMNSPSVIFIDEFQALFTERGTGGSGRLSTTLLQLMDDAKRWSDADFAESSAGETATDESSRVVVLAATNTPWMVDKAFLRPGRFDRSVHVGLPDEKSRESILHLHANRMKTMSREENLRICRRVSRMTNGFSGADLAALCRAAAVRCLIEGAQYVEESHFLSAREHDISPSVNAAMVQRIRDWQS